MDSNEAAIGNSSDLNDVQKFIYIRGYLTDGALNSISGLTLTNENYRKALTVLKKSYGNKQAIVSTRMEKLANLQVVSSDANMTVLRKLFDEIKSNLRSPEGEQLRIATVPIIQIIMNRLSQQLKIVASQNLSSDLLNFTKLLKIMKLEITAPENCDYNCDVIGKNDNFMSEDWLSFALALYSQPEKRPKLVFFAKVAIGYIDIPL